MSFKLIMAIKEKNQPQKNIRDFQNHTSKGSKMGKYLWRKFLESPLSAEFSTKGWLAGQNFSECGGWNVASPESNYCLSWAITSPLLSHSFLTSGSRLSGETFRYINLAPIFSQPQRSECHQIASEAFNRGIPTLLQPPSWYFQQCMLNAP